MLCLEFMFKNSSFTGGKPLKSINYSSVLGDPLIPEDEEYPVCEICETQMTNLLSLNLSTMPFNGMMTSTGLVFVYCCVNESCTYFSKMGEPNTSIYHAAADEVIKGAVQRRDKKSKRLVFVGAVPKLLDDSEEVSRVWREESKTHIVVDFASLDYRFKFKSGKDAFILSACELVDTVSGVRIEQFTLCKLESVRSKAVCKTVMKKEKPKKKKKAQSSDEEEEEEEEPLPKKSKAKKVPIKRAKEPEPEPEEDEEDEEEAVEKKSFTSNPSKVLMSKGQRKAPPQARVQEKPAPFVARGKPQIVQASEAPQGRPVMKQPEPSQARPVMKQPEGPQSYSRIVKAAEVQQVRKPSPVALVSRRSTASSKKPTMVDAEPVEERNSDLDFINGTPKIGFISKKSLKLKNKKRMVPDTKAMEELRAAANGSS